MGKKTKDELKADLTAAREEKKAAFEEKRAFEKENKLEKGADHSGHEKLGKKWTKLETGLKAKQDKIKKIEEDIASLKKESSSSRTVYDYPEDIKSAADRKKYRAKARAAKKKAEKGETDKPKKEKKSEVAAEVPAKKKKKEKVAEAED